MAPVPGMEANIHVVDGGDHSFKIPKGSKQPQAQVFADIQDRLARWMAGQ